MAEPLLSLKGITRTYGSGDTPQTVLDNVSLDIHPGEMVAIMGASGSGKSTLMNIMGCLDTATSGTYLFAGRDVSQMSPDERAALRREHFGFISSANSCLAITMRWALSRSPASMPHPGRATGGGFRIDWSSGWG